MKLKIEIKNRWTGKVIFEFETENNTVAKTINEAVRLASEKGERANLSEANLSKANLSKANLSKADLSWADLSKADLSEANLSKADLSKADLSWANLSKANLSEADLSKADLSEADLSVVKNDIWAILLRSNEVSFLLQSLRDGKVDGSCYEGACCCLVGTIAKSKGCDFKNAELMNGLKPDSSRPAERWFLGIREGDIPEKSNVTKLTIEWIEEFQSLLEFQKSK